jgi:hypothetical protein
MYLFGVKLASCIFLMEDAKDWTSFTWGWGLKGKDVALLHLAIYCQAGAIRTGKERAGAL